LDLIGKKARQNCGGPSRWITGGDQVGIISTRPLR
jgi:hypothetical protein